MSFYANSVTQGGEIKGTFTADQILRTQSGTFSQLLIIQRGGE